MKHSELGKYNETVNRMERENATFRHSRTTVIVSVIAAVATIGSLIISILK